MSAKQLFQDKAYVLHCRAYRNTSLIADVFTREHGRINAVAKGAKRGQHPLSTLLQPFNPLQVQWGGGGELVTLYRAEQLVTAHAGAGTDFYSGFYLNELLARLLHKHDPHPELFDCYAGCLAQLQSAGERDIALRYFELDLLEGLGYAMNLHSEALSGKPIDAAQAYQYVIDEGPVPAREQLPDTLVIAGTTLIALAQRELAGDTQRNEAKQLLRSVLDHYLGHRPLKSRELLLSKKLMLASGPTCD